MEKPLKLEMLPWKLGYDRDREFYYYCTSTMGENRHLRPLYSRKKSYLKMRFKDKTSN